MSKYSAHECENMNVNPACKDASMGSRSKIMWRMTVLSHALAWRLERSTSLDNVNSKIGMN